MLKYSKKKLFEIASILNGYAFKSKNYTTSGIRIIRIANVQDGFIVDNSPCFYPIDESEDIKSSFLYENDLLISLTGNVGRVGILNKSLLPAALNQRVACIRPDLTVINVKFLFYYLQQNSFQNSCIQAARGMAQLNLSSKWLAEYELPVPPLPEQERIVAKIEELFSQLDAAVAELKSVKEKLAIYRQAVLKEAFEGKLTEKWRILHHKNNEWCVFNIKNIVQKGQNSLKAGPFGSALKKSCYVPSGYKVYGQEQVIAGNENIGDYYISEEKYQELISCKIEPYDILISLVGTVGKVLILSAECEPGVINPRLIKVSLDRKKMLPEFFKYYFTSNYLKSLYKQKVHGATMDVLNMGMIKELPFQWCPIDEQRQVMSEIEARISICNNIEQTVDTALQQAAALRQSILKQAFEGNL